MEQCRVDGCLSRVAGRGLCSRHYQRLQKGQDLDAPFRFVTARTDQERFWAKVDVTGFCWLWTASVNKHGYGRFGRGSAWSVAHRYAYTTLVGPIPEGLHLDHLCRVPRCVNPDHLQPVTPKINAFRGMSANQRTHRDGVCKRGHSMDDAYVAPSTGRRACRECRRLRKKGLI